MVIMVSLIAKKKSQFAVVYLPRVELGSMPSEGIILSIRLQVGTLFIVAYFVFIRKGYEDIFPFRQNFL